MTLLLALALLAPACGDDDDATGDTGDTDTGSEATTGALTLEGTWTTTPAVGPATLTVTITDDTGAAVEGATVTAHAQMPSMGHGTPAKPSVTAKGGGQYEVRLTFNMPGYWEVTVTATAGDQTGSVVMKETL